VKPRHLAIICGVLDASEPVGEQALALANERIERGDRVSLLALSNNEADLDPRINVIAAGSTPKRIWIEMIPYLRWLSRTLDDIQPDHTISMLGTVPATTMVPVTGLLRARRRAGRDLCDGIIETCAQRLGTLLPSPLVMGWLEQRAIASDRVKTFVALTPLIKQSLEQDERTHSQVIESADIALATQPINQEHAERMRTQLSRALGIAPESYWIALPFDDARLDGFETMIRAFAPLIKQGIDATLLLAGPTRYTQFAWIGELGLRDHVRLIGRTPRREQLFAACDLVVNPTGYDPLGHAIRQAIAAGKPFISTTCSGAANSAREDFDTVLPAPVTPETLLDTIRREHERWRRGEPQSPPIDRQTPPEPSLAAVIDRIAREQAS